MMTMENLIKVSIIIPCYNNGNYLIEMLKCFKRQTVPYWEVIIVDDGSTDDTPTKIYEFIKDEPRISFFTRDRLPKGSVVCRNIGFEKARGQYICHLDADDLISNTFVEHRVEFMDTHLDVDYASFCAKVFIDGRSALPNYNSKVRTYGVKVQTGDLLEDFLSANYSFSVWNNIYRRESIANMPWDENVKIYTDFSFIIPGILQGLRHSFSDIKEVDYYYRIFLAKTSSGNMCSNFVSDDKIKSTIYLFTKILNQLEYLPDSHVRKIQFLNFIILNFERLLKQRQFKEADEYIELLKNHYPAEIISKFKKTQTKCANSSNSKMYNTKMYWAIVRQLGGRRYYRYLLHSFVKDVINN